MLRRPKTRPKASVTIHNERCKLRATFFNSLATASMTVGVAAPFAGYMFGSLTNFPFPLVLIWIFAAIALHYVGILNIDEVKEP